MGRDGLLGVVYCTTVSPPRPHFSFCIPAHHVSWLALNGVSDQKMSVFQFQEPDGDNCVGSDCDYLLHPA